MAIHESEKVLAGQVESALRFTSGTGNGDGLGMTVNANYNTNQATTLANIAARTGFVNPAASNANILTGMRPDLIGLYLGLTEAVKLGYAVVGAATMNVDLSNPTTGILDAIEATWQPGLCN